MEIKHLVIATNNLLQAQRDRNVANIEFFTNIAIKIAENLVKEETSTINKTILNEILSSLEQGDFIGYMQGSPNCYMILSGFVRPGKLSTATAKNVYTKIKKSSDKTVRTKKMSLLSEVMFFGDSISEYSSVAANYLAACCFSSM